MIITEHGGYCDYCGKHKGKFARDKQDSNRDICLDCIVEAYNLFGPKDLLERTMTMFSNIAKRLLDSKTKTLIKAGYLSTDLKLTSVGEEALLAGLLAENMEELVKSAEEKIEEEKESAN